MRISEFEKESILKTAWEIFGKNSVVSLFGSRIDDTKLGGDIDLYIEPENLVRKSISSICNGEILYSQWDHDELPSEMANQFQVRLSVMVIRLRELRLIPNGF